jgi:hypothetical protein
MSELPIITGNFHNKKPVTVVKKMTGTPVAVITGASTLFLAGSTENMFSLVFDTMQPDMFWERCPIWKL